MKVKLGVYIDEEIIGLQKLMKLVPLCLKAQADMLLHVHECCSQHGRRDCRNCRNGADCVSIAKYRVLPNFILISKLLCGL
jgi:hypothetical protein